MVSTVFAAPRSSFYHKDTNCPRLADGDLTPLGYRKFSEQEAIRMGQKPCPICLGKQPSKK